MIVASPNPKIQTPFLVSIAAHRHLGVRTFTKYAGNPVLENDAAGAVHHVIWIHASADLKSWRRECRGLASMYAQLRECTGGGTVAGGKLMSICR